MFRFRRLAAAVAVALGVGLTTAVQPATAAEVVYIANTSVTRVFHGATYAVLGYAAPGATVVLHYHRAGTPASDYSIERAVRADSDGFWYREATLDVDYRVFATVGRGNPHSATVTFTSAGASAPRITSPAVTDKPFGQLYTVKGTAAPFVQVVVHYRRSTAPTVDIARVVYTDEKGAWSRDAVLDASYSVYATIGTGNPHSGTVRFLGHTATVGDVLDIDYAPTSGPRDDVQTTVGAQLRSYENDLPGLIPVPGNRWVQVETCVRNRGPQQFSDSATGSMVLLEDDGTYYNPQAAGGSTKPVLNLSSMSVNELRCGALSYSVPTTRTIVSLAYAPGLEVGYYQGRWTVSGPATAGIAAAAPRATPVAPARPAVSAPSDAARSALVPAGR